MKLRAGCAMRALGAAELRDTVVAVVRLLKRLAIFEEYTQQLTLV